VTKAQHAHYGEVRKAARASHPADPQKVRDWHADVRMPWPPHHRAVQEDDLHYRSALEGAGVAEEVFPYKYNRHHNYTDETKREEGNG